MKKAKVRLRKFGPGGEFQDDQEDPMYSNSNVAGKKQPKANINYAAVASTGVNSYNNYQNVVSNPNATSQDRYNARADGYSNTIGSANPVVGTVIGIGDSIGKPIKAKSEQFDADGELINEKKAKRNGVIGSLFSPSKAFAYRQESGNWGDVSGNGYTSWLETNEKKRLADIQASKPVIQQEATPILPMNQQTVQYARMGGRIRYDNGGYVENPNAEVEKQENTLNPDGSTTQFNGPTHEEGGIPTNLDPNTLIFSDKLKLNKKTFADLNKPNMTLKEDKILENNKATNTAKTTADLMKHVKNMKSLELFNTQEELKQTKLESYAKRLGITGNKFGNGGQFGEPLSTTGSFSQLSDKQLADQWNMNPQFKGKPYTTQMNTTMGGNGKPYYQYNYYAQNSQPAPRNQPMIQQPQIVNNQPIQDPMKQVGYNGMQAPIVEKFKGGGKKGYDYSPKPITVDEGVNMEAPQYTDPSGNNFYASQNNSGININELAGEPVDTNGVYAFQRANSKNSGNYIEPKNPYIIPNGGNQNGNRPDYTNIAAQIGAGIAANAGNLYDLKRSKKVDNEVYNRVNPTLLDPSAAFQYNNGVFAKGEQDVKNASGGDASTYLQNRSSLAINKMMANARIKMDYDNQNAGITNQAKYYNAGTGDKETIANLMNQAQSRNLKGAAISAIGSNVSNSILGSTKDRNSAQRDSDYLKIIAVKYPEIMKDPELAKLYK